MKVEKANSLPFFLLTTTIITVYKNIFGVIMHKHAFKNHNMGEMLG